MHAFEERLLTLVLQRGLVSHADLARLRREEATGDSHTLVLSQYGRSGDLLLAMGLLKEEQVQALVQELHANPGPAPSNHTMELLAFTGEELGASFASGERVKALAMTFPVPDWDRYEHIEYLDQGGMARVFKATDPRLKRDVALKLLNNPDPRALTRFMQEARFQARVEHPHVCRIYEVGEVAGHPYIAMEFVQGRPIDELAGQMGQEQLVRAIQEVAEAVHAAHRLGLIHRDLKPQNILVEKRDAGWWPVVLDFGLASEKEGQGLTVAGTVMGTPAYMSPEQARGETERLDRRTDVYALGCTLYALLLGRPPFPGGEVLQTMLRVIHEEPPRPRSLQPKLPEDLETILLKCLEKEPQHRYDNAKLLAEDLQRYLNGDALLAKPLGRRDRWRKLIRRNPTLSAVVAVAAVTVLLLGGIAVRAQWRALTQAQLAQRFGLESERMEGSFRRAQMLPLHDMRPHKTELRAWMGQLEQQMHKLGAVANGPGHFALGRAYLALGEPRPAVAHLERAWQAGSRGPESAAALGLAQVMILREALDEAERISSKESKAARLAELNQRHVQPALKYLRLSGTSHSVVNEGLIAYLERHYDEALGKAQEALARDPWLVEAHLLTAQVYLAQTREMVDQGAYDQAAKACAQGLAASLQAEQVSRSMVEAYTLEGEAHSLQMDLAIRLGHPFTDQAEATRRTLQNALAVDPESAEGNVKMARLYRRWADADVEQGKDAAALLTASVAHAMEALRNSPGHPEASLFLSMTYRAQAEQQTTHGLDPLPALEKSLTSGQQAIALRPRDAIVLNSQGNTFLSKAEFLNDRGQDSTEALHSALAAFEASCQMNPSYYAPWINRGICWRRLATLQALRGDNPLPLMERSLTCYREALKVNPKQLTSLNNLGVLCRYKGEMELKRGLDPTSSLEQAVSAFQQALEINPTFARSHEGLSGAATVYAFRAWQQGKDPLPAFQEALAHNRKALACNPADAELQQHRGQACLDQAEYLVAKGRNAHAALEAARTAFDQALRINAKSVDSLLGQARVQLLRSAMAEAQALTGRAQEISPGLAKPLLLKAEIALAKAGQRSGAAREPELKLAESALNAAAALEPHSAQREVLWAQHLLLSPAPAATQASRAHQAQTRLRRAFQEDGILELVYQRWLTKAEKAERDGARS